jgi:protein-S-isoprenylcysteine O-methyltransferase Ste14
MLRLLAAGMAAVNAAAWIVVSRWEKPGTRATYRVRLRAPRLIELGFNASLYTALVYPVLVVLAPRWTVEGPANWPPRIDGVLRAGGLVVWMLGMAVMLWASRVMGRHLAIDGLAEDHELVTRGPYRYVRHPVYASFAAIVIGTALVFRSSVLAGFSVMLMLTGRWWANAEEELLASSEGFGDAYRTYAARTGRFFPRLRRSRAAGRAGVGRRPWRGRGRPDRRKAGS